MRRGGARRSNLDVVTRPRGLSYGFLRYILFSPRFSRSVITIIPKAGSAGRRDHSFIALVSTILLMNFLLYFLSGLFERSSPSFQTHKTKRIRENQLNIKIITLKKYLILIKFRLFVSIESKTKKKSYSPIK